MPTSVWTILLSHGVKAFVGHLTPNILRQAWEQRRTFSLCRTAPHLPTTCHLSQGSWSVFAASWITTATGRVLGDAHWVSDTLAAGFLSLAVAVSVQGQLRPLASLSRLCCLGGCAVDAALGLAVLVQTSWTKAPHT